MNWKKSNHYWKGDNNTKRSLASPRHDLNFEVSDHKFVDLHDSMCSSQNTRVSKSLKLKLYNCWERKTWQQMCMVHTQLLMMWTCIPWCSGFLASTCHESMNQRYCFSFFNICHYEKTNAWNHQTTIYSSTSTKQIVRHLTNNRPVNRASLFPTKLWHVKPVTRETCHTEIIYFKQHPVAEEIRFQ